MKSRIMMSVLVIALAAALIAGATAAWLTAEADLPEAEFTAGTLVVNVDESSPSVSLPKGRYIDNINPGDCATVCWKIINDGTKGAELRVKIEDAWAFIEDNVPEVVEQVAFFAPKPDSGWVMYEVTEGTEDEIGMWLYYTGGPVRGTYKDKDPKSVKLCLVIGFDGEKMGNEYQGATYEISGRVEAVQWTNGAPEAVWGQAWTDVKNGDVYVEEYFAEGNPGYNMPCWPKEQEDPEDPKPEYTVLANIVEEGNGSVNGTGSFLPGQAVQLEAIPEEGFEFTGWEGTEGLPDVSIDGAMLSFTMPADNVTVTAVFEEIPEPSVVTRIEIFGADRIKIPYQGSKTEQYTAKVYDQYENEMSGQAVVWSEDKQNVDINNNGLLTVNKNASIGNVTITAKVGTVSGIKTVELYKSFH